MENIFNSQGFDLSSEQVELLVQASTEAYEDNPSLAGYTAITPQLPGLPSDLIVGGTYSKPGNVEIELTDTFGRVFKTVPVYGDADATVFKSNTEPETLLLAFRGTEFESFAEGIDAGDPFYWTRLPQFYELFSELLDALDAYVEENGISNVLVTGHSLGAAMVEIYMEEKLAEGNSDINYQAVAVASPTASRVVNDEYNSQVLNIGHQNDQVYSVRLDKNINTANATSNIYIDDGSKAAFIPGPFSPHSQKNYQYTTQRIIDSKYYDEMSRDSLVIIDRTDSRVETSTYTSASSEISFILGENDGEDSLVVDSNINNGNDILEGSNRPEIIEGLGGNDTIIGDNNNPIITEAIISDGREDILKDTLDGGRGNDVLDGGDGDDTAIFSDDFENYDYSIDPVTKVITFDHVRGTQTDGRDTLKKIEFAQFSDRLVPLPLGQPIDVVFLQDLSGSFEDDLTSLQSLAPSLVDTLVEENPDTFFGVASFIDRPDDPDGSPNDYFYRTELPITDSEDSIINTINSLSTIDGGNEPEAQLTALLEIATRTEELGYRDGSTRYVFLSTDASYNEGGIYPNVEQVKVALEESNITPIFLVNSNETETNVPGIYNELVARLERGEVLSLSSDSSNITDAVRQAFAEIDDEVTTSGTDEDDALTGTDEDDGIFGGLGDDTIDGASGDDVLDGGGGDDELSGSEGDDELNGGTGLDVLDGGSGSDLIEGGLDADTLTGSEAADTFSGTLDELNDDVILDFTEEDRIIVKDANFTEDNLTVTEGSAILDIDADSDGTSDATITLEGDFSEFDFVVDSESSEGITNTIIAIEQSESPSENVVDGTDEDDSLIGSDKNDVLVGFGGNDFLEGLDGEDELDGGMGDDSLEGGQQNDSLYGRDGEDTLRGSGGADELFGGDGNDELKGSSGNDRVFGEAGNDILFGGSDNDELFGNDDDDTLFGGIGSDSLDGGSGNDRLLGVNPATDELFGRSTIDTLTGGSGSNTFVLGEGENDVFYDSGIPDNLGTSDYALITDFQLGQDSLELAGSRSDYSFGLTFDDLPTGLAVYHQPESSDRELIAVLQSDNLLATSEDIENAKAALEIDNFVDSSLEI